MLAKLEQYRRQRDWLIRIWTFEFKDTQLIWAAASNTSRSLFLFRLHTAKGGKYHVFIESFLSSTMLSLGAYPFLSYSFIFIYFIFFLLFYPSTFYFQLFSGDVVPFYNYLAFQYYRFSIKVQTRSHISFFCRLL